MLDGARMPTLDAAAAEAARSLLGDPSWRGDLGALGDALALASRAGRFGGVRRVVWRDAERARQALDHPEAARYLTRRLRDCPPNVLIKTAWALRAALRGTGPTAFDLLGAAVARAGVPVTGDAQAGGARDAPRARG